MSTPEPLELQLQRERLARIRIESQLEEAKLQIVEMELTLRQLRELLAIPGFTLGSTPPVSDEPGDEADAVEPAQAPPPKGKAAASPPPAPEPVPAASAPVNSAPPSRKRSNSSRRASAKSVAAEPVEPVDLDVSLDEGDGGTATMMRVSPPPILSTLPLHENDNRDVIREFIDHTHTRIEKMQATLASMNMKELKWHVAWLKENAVKVGFEVLVEPLELMEEAIEEEKNGLIGEGLDAFMQLTDRITLEPPKK